MDKRRVGQFPITRGVNQIVIEYRSCNRVLTLENGCQMFGPEAASGPKFQD